MKKIPDETKPLLSHKTAPFQPLETGHLSYLHLRCIPYMRTGTFPVSWPAFESVCLCRNISYKMGIIYYIVVIFFNYIYLIDIVFVNIIQS